MSSFDPRAHWEGVLQKEPGLEGVGYRGLGEPFNRWMYHVRRRVVLRALRPFVSQLPSPAVLDIGSGTGFYIARWRELGVRSLMGADLTETVVERLRVRYPEHRFERLDIGGEPETLPAERFGGISAFDVLFHIVDDERWRQAFSNIASLLEPGGLFFFSENFIHGEVTTTEDQASRPLAEIESVLADNGLEVLLRRPMFFLMNEPVDSASRLHQAFWWRLVGQLRARGPRAQWLAGAALYPFELAILALLGGEGPSTELMVCRKRA